MDENLHDGLHSCNAVGLFRLFLFLLGGNETVGLVRSGAVFGLGFYAVFSRNRAFFGCKISKNATEIFKIFHLPFYGTGRKNPLFFFFAFFGGRDANDSEIA